MFIDLKTNFFDHKVTPEGLYIRGLGNPRGMAEIFVDRDTAEAMGWIDPLQEFDRAIIEIATVEGPREVEAMVHASGLAYRLVNGEFTVTHINSGRAIEPDLPIETPEMAQQFICECANLLPWTKDGEELREEIQQKFGAYAQLKEILNQALDKAKKALAEEMVEA